VKATIRDKQVLESIRPFEVATYLRSTGWKVGKEEPGKFSVWLKPDEKNDDYEIVLPLARQYRDFALRISDLLQTLEVAEKRSQLEIFADVQTASADVVRVRFHQAETEDGTISLQQGVSLIENARELMLSAACAAVEPRSYFATRKPDRASEYLQHLRLGQSELGSYVVRVISPVPPRLEGEQTVLFGEPNAPFERQVTRGLLRALQRLRQAADDAMSSGKWDHFQEAVPDGVSANLCSALVKMSETARTASDSLTVSVSWAKSRPVDGQAAPAVSFPGDRFPVIEEAARVFKASAPREEIEVRGVVVRLQRQGEQGPPTGPILLHTFIEGKPRKVQIDLAEPEHRIALQAYPDAATVRCTGDLVRTGQIYTLRNPSGFAIVPDEPGDS
jgi:hypothetical protein